MIPLYRLALAYVAWIVGMAGITGSLYFVSIVHSSVCVQWQAFVLFPVGMASGVWGQLTIQASDDLKRSREARQ